MSEENMTKQAFAALVVAIYTLARDFCVGVGLAMLLSMPRDRCLKAGATVAAITLFFMVVRGAINYGRNTAGAKQ